MFGNRMVKLVMQSLIDSRCRSPIGSMTIVFLLRRPELPLRVAFDLKFCRGITQRGSQRGIDLNLLSCAFTSGG
jgi:hypothetical protein